VVGFGSWFEGTYGTLNNTQYKGDGLNQISVWGHGTLTSI